MENKLGDYIRQQRGKKSLRELAKKCDISHTHLDSIEKGYDPRTNKPVRVTVETLNKIAKALNTTINELLVISGVVEDENKIYSDDKIKYYSNKNFNKDKLKTELKQKYKLDEKSIEDIWQEIEKIIESK